MLSPPIRRALLFSTLAAGVGLGCASTTNFGPEYERDPSTTSAATVAVDGGSATPTSAKRKDPFEGAPAYASALPDGRATLSHVRGNVGVVPGKDTKCLGCHGTKGEAAAPRFVFGGTAFEDAPGTIAAKDMELGVVDSAGKTFFVHSDEDGNFWAPGTPDLTYPAYASIRFGDKTKPMKKRIVDETELECASCHDATNRILKP